jgi:hypothetical protein
LDQSGRRIVEQTTDDPGIPAGTRWLLLGDSFECGGVRIFFTGQRTGRPPTPDETTGAHNPYKPPRQVRPKREVDEAQLADAEAIRLARIEQETEPADLIGAQSRSTDGFR